ncbi:MAG: exodeoxyribonuclease VII small subunit [Clostridia bacterium]|nr:exodeoxyribonuclease VII small subunit [Clostridia bacterium]
MAKKKLTFEDGIVEFEGIVDSLEKGALPLEESMKAYEKAVALEQSLRAMLNSMDGRIRELTAQGQTDFEEISHADDE